MTKLVLRGILARKLRTVLTSIAIVLGVAMIVGTYVLTDQIDRAFTNIFQDANAGTDVILTEKTEFTPSGGTSQGGPLPASLIAQVAGIDGVRTTSGQIIASGGLVVDGDYVQATGGAPNLVISNVPEPFNTADYVDGGPPSNGQVAIDENTAGDEDLSVGDRVQFATDAGVEDVTVSGVLDASGTSFGGARLVVPTFADAQQWFDRQGQTSTILVAGDEGVSDAELVQRVQSQVPSTVRVETGEENAARQSDELNDAIGGFLRPALLAFAFVAILVGAFIIFNTFSITVAQRMRELALVRTLGASRRQVLRSVIGEALVVGLVASAIGIGGGYLFARGLNALFDLIGFGLPTASPRLVVNGIVYALIAGIGVTLVAALVPALRATRVPPIAALREGATLPPSRISRYTPWISGVLIALGLAIVVRALFSDAPATDQLIGLAVGALLVFFGVAGLSKFVVGPLASAIGWPLERLAPASGRLARENAMRNPSRTAVTSAALMIGVGVVVFIAVFVNGIKTSFFDALDRSVTSDLIISSSNFSPIPARTVTVARSVPGVENAAASYFDQVEVGSSQEAMNGVDPANIASVYRFDWIEGGDASVAALGDDGTLIEEGFAKSRNLDVGDTFTIRGQTGDSQQVEVAGIYKDPQLFTGFMVGETLFKEISPIDNPFLVQAKYADGADPDQTQAAVERAFERFPAARVQSNVQYKADVEDQLNQLLGLVYALLAMAVLISLVGIVNTLALSVFERTREIGMLRAIGTTRRQLRRMVRYESVITAIIGGLLGIVIGVVFAWIVSRGLEDEGILFAVPVGQLVASLVVAAIAGVVAAALPARRASRLSPLDALHYE